MAAVVGFLDHQLRDLGHRRYFPGFGGSTVAKVGRNRDFNGAVRTRYNEQLQQLGRQLGRPITPGPGAGLPASSSERSARMIASAALDERRAANSGSAFRTPRW